VGGAFTPDAIEIVLEASGGYPYFLQEFGKAIWHTAPASPFDTEDAHPAVEEGRRALDDGFIPSRWTQATDRERRYLRAIAETGNPLPGPGRSPRPWGWRRPRSVMSVIPASKRGSSGHPNLPISRAPMMPLRSERRRANETRLSWR
jgi:hypothetical protein